MHTFPGGVTLVTPGTQTVTATDPSSGITGSATITVTGSVSAVAAFVLSVPASVTAGSPFDVTVTAVDSNGNVVPGYTGTVAFTSTDTAAGVVLPSNYTFTASDSGVHTFPGGVTLVTPGTQTVTATDVSSAITGSATITVTSPVPAAAQFVPSVPASVTAGSPFDVTVTAEDSNGNVVPGYTGTVTFTSTDTYPAVLPAPYTFTSSDQGVRTFSSGVTLFTAGTQTLTVQDTTDSSITGSMPIAVSPSSATSLLLNAPSTAVAGTAFNVTVTAFDAYGNVATGYTGTVRLLTSSDHDTPPSDYTFTQSDNGTHTFSVTLFTAGVQTLLVQDAANGAITDS